MNDLRTIARIVAEVTGVSEREFLSGSRFTPSVIARSFCCLIARRMTAESFRSIAREYGITDATVRRANERGEFLTENYPLHRRTFGRCVARVEEEG